MTVLHRIAIALTASLITTLTAKADILISDFNSFAGTFYPMSGNWGTPVDQYSQGAGFISITATGGGDPKGDGNFDAVLPGSSLASPSSMSFAGLSFLSINARVDSGNQSSLTVILRDSSFTQAAVATFLASSFTSSFSTVNSALTLAGGGSINDITFWEVTGDGLASDSFRYSFDNLSAIAVPEPSAYALSACGLLVICAAVRHARNRRSAISV